MPGDQRPTVGLSAILLWLGWFWLQLGSAAIHEGGTTGTYSYDEVVSVEFYGESQCPYCRRFVRDAWPTVWDDKELMKHVQYDFVAWGNAYFTTSKCSRSETYSAEDRACWYQECIDVANDTPKDDDCFTGKVIYQHSEKEGQVDIYEMCVKLHYGLDAAVRFTYCCEGPNMDTSDSAYDLLEVCIEDLDIDLIQDCFTTHGHIMEVLAAKQTPSHPGVPYVLVDGVALDDPFSVRTAICNRLVQKMSNDGTVYDESNTRKNNPSLPKACNVSNPIHFIDSK